MNYEERFWELRENYERAHDRMMGSPTPGNLANHVNTRIVYQDFCMEVLEMLMDKNPDALANL